MKRVHTKQILFLVFATIALVLVMGIFFIPKAEAQTFFGNQWQDSNWNWDDDWDRSERNSPLFRYNRVEGFFAGYRMNRDYWRERRPVSPIIFGHAGYAFSAKELEYQIGLEQGFNSRSRFAIGGEHHRLIVSADNWIISESENSLAAVLIKEDFRDYFFKEGGSLYFTQQIFQSLTITGGYYFDRWDSVERNATWSIFGKNKKFRDNPGMDTGVINSLKGQLVLDTRGHSRHTMKGWYAALDYEHSGDDLGGDFTFDRLLADFRRYQPLGFDLGIDLRLRVGSSRGILPYQKSYHLGGISTLRGFRYKELGGGFRNAGGNRMILAQIEYQLGESNLPEFLDLGLFDLFNITIFADAGWVGRAGENADLLEGFANLEWSDFKSDAGIAFISGNVRFEIARRLDTGYKPFRFYFRLNRPF